MFSILSHRNASHNYFDNPYFFLHFIYCLLKIDSSYTIHPHHSFSLHSAQLSPIPPLPQIHTSISSEKNRLPIYDSQIGQSKIKLRQEKSPNIKTTQGNLIGGKKSQKLAEVSRNTQSHG